MTPTFHWLAIAELWAVPPCAVAIARGMASFGGPLLKPQRVAGAETVRAARAVQVRWIIAAVAIAAVVAAVATPRAPSDKWLAFARVHN